MQRCFIALFAASYSCMNGAGSPTAHRVSDCVRCGDKAEVIQKNFHLFTHWPRLQLPRALRDSADAQINIQIKTKINTQTLHSRDGCAYPHQHTQRTQPTPLCFSHCTQHARWTRIFFYSAFAGECNAGIITADTTSLPQNRHLKTAGEKKRQRRDAKGMRRNIPTAQKMSSYNHSRKYAARNTLKAQKNSEKETLSIEFPLLSNPATCLNWEEEERWRNASRSREKETHTMHKLHQCHTRHTHRERT